MANILELPSKDGNITPEKARKLRQMQFHDKTAYVLGLRYRWDPLLSMNPARRFAHFMPPWYLVDCVIFQTCAACSSSPMRPGRPVGLEIDIKAGQREETTIKPSVKKCFKGLVWLKQEEVLIWFEEETFAWLQWAPLAGLSAGGALESAGGSRIIMHIGRGGNVSL